MTQLLENYKDEVSTTLTELQDYPDYRWLWYAIERVAAGEDGQEVLKDYGFVKTV